MSKPIYYIELKLARKKSSGKKVTLEPIGGIMGVPSTSNDIGSSILLKDAVSIFFHLKSRNEDINEYAITEIISCKQVGETHESN